MKLPSGIELSHEKVEELCEVVIREKFQLECTFVEAFESTADGLREGGFDGIPVLESEDIKFLSDALANMVIFCVVALESTLGTYLEEHLRVAETPKPKCPKCGKEIEFLCGDYPAAVPAKAYISEGELHTDVIDGIRVSDVIEGDVKTWHCPECDAELFKTGEEGKVEEFLKGEGGSE